MELSDGGTKTLRLQLRRNPAVRWSDWLGINVKTIKIDGPVAVMEFAGDIKPKAKRLKYVAAAWLKSGNTMVAVKLPRHVDSAESATPIVSKDIGAKPIAVHFSKSGCDVIQQPYGFN